MNLLPNNNASVSIRRPTLLAVFRYIYMAMQGHYCYDIYTVHIISSRSHPSNHPSIYYDNWAFGLIDDYLLTCRGWWDERGCQFLSICISSAQVHCMQVKYYFGRCCRYTFFILAATNKFSDTLKINLLRRTTSAPPPSIITHYSRIQLSSVCPSKYWNTITYIYIHMHVYSHESSPL